MRWEDERYVRVYTRDTGDWLSLSFEAQALFLMLLRKVDRIGELHLGRRGLDSVPALLGHPDKAERLTPALRELLADGCVRLADDGAKLFVPNFLKAQEAAKSPAERKREQRERDAAKALENTQLSRDVTPGHEMSPRAVPCRAVPPVPCLPNSPIVADATPVVATPVEEAFAAVRPSRRKGEKPKRTELPPAPGWSELVALLYVAFKANRGVDPSPAGKDWAALRRLRGRAKGGDVEIVRRWTRGVGEQFKARTDSFDDLDKRWDSLAGGGDPPTRAGGARFVNAQDVKHTDVNVGVVKNAF